MSGLCGKGLKHWQTTNIAEIVAVVCESEGKSKNVGAFQEYKLFPTMFFVLLKTNFITLIATFCFSSVSPITVNIARNLSFGEETMSINELILVFVVLIMTPNHWTKF